MEDEILLKSQIRHGRVFVNDDYKNGNNDKRGEFIFSISTEKMHKFLFEEALRKDFSLKRMMDKVSEINGFEYD